MAELKEYKQEIIDVLNGMKGRIRIIEDPEHRFEPFLLTYHFGVGHDLCHCHQRH